MLESTDRESHFLSPFALTRSGSLLTFLFLRPRRFVFNSMAELYPHFNERLRDSLVILLGEKLAKRVRISLAKDGSGVGGESFVFAFSTVSSSSF